MADTKQQQTARVGGVESNPMNLTCKPVSEPVDVRATAEVKTAAGDTYTKYALVINGTSPAAPPNGTWTKIFVSTEAYEVKSSDGTVSFTIPAGDLGIYGK